MGMTISEGMVLQKTIRQRLNELQTLRNANAVRRNTFYMHNSGEEKQREEVEPQYDPKQVDKKIVELEIFLFKLDSSIKKANAKTAIDVEANVDKLLEPIQ